MQKLKSITFIFMGFLISSCSSSEKIYEDSSNKLYNTIFQQDSIFFQAYNNCDLDKQSEYYSNNIEFYHDQGGLMTSKEQILKATKDNICGKITRRLIKSSLEVYPINGYGAVEIGLHEFQQKGQDNETQSKPDKFIIIWQQKENKWEISRVISLH